MDEARSAAGIKWLSDLAGCSDGLARVVTAGLTRCPALGSDEDTALAGE